MLSRRILRFDAPALAGEEWPCFEVVGAARGPRLCVLAGVHGCEYSPIAAAMLFARALDPGVLTGAVTVVPIVNPASFRTRTPFVSPGDGKNLNRCFPGDPDGTYSDQLAHHLFTELIAPADALIDMHAGDMVEALAPFTLYDESPVGDRSREMALAYGLPYVVAPTPEPGGTAIGGTTSAAAAAAGIPAITPEVGGRGLLDEDDVWSHLNGLRNVLRLLGMLADPPTLPAAPQTLVRRFVWLRSGAAGWWQPDVRPGDPVAAGDRLGAVLDGFGDELETIAAPEAGTPLFVTTSPAVAADGLLLGLGAGLEPVPGTHPQPEAISSRTSPTPSLQTRPQSSSDRS